MSVKRYLTKKVISE